LAESSPGLSIAGFLIIKWVIFSTTPFTAVNPSHCRDVCKAFAWFTTPVSLMPVFQVDALLWVELVIDSIVDFFVFVHGSPMDGGWSITDKMDLKQMMRKSYDFFNALNGENQPFTSADFERKI
jgi:hypothetical protein